MLVKSKDRNNKFLYYLGNYLALRIPNYFYRQWRKGVLNRSLDEAQWKEAMDRVNYYNKMEEVGPVWNQDTKRLGDMSLAMGFRTYFFDFYRYGRCFNPDLKVNVDFGDVTEVPPVPAVVKTRPIHEDHRNSVLMKLNVVRHYFFVDDCIPFEAKKDKLVWRGKISNLKSTRIEFLKKFIDHPDCNVGANNSYPQNPRFEKPRMTKKEQLNYKFILCLEGIDVSTSLKWVMSSNSLTVCPKPKFESWFMEGRLQSGVHYVEVKDDFSDLMEKMDYYTKNPIEAQKIIEHANAYAAQFTDRKKENLISLLVLEKYFAQTRQKTDWSPPIKLQGATSKI